MAKIQAPKLYSISPPPTARRHLRSAGSQSGTAVSHLRNRVGIKAYQKAGFNEIGRRRECRMMGGKLWDEVYMDCLSSEFERPVTPGKVWGFSAWLPPGGTPQIEVGTDDGGGSC